jgi:uncharacterized membrane protein
VHLIPQSWSHLHLLVSVFPSVGLLFVVGLLITAIAANNQGMKLTSLVGLVVLALLAIPTYLSGTGSEAALSGKPTVDPDMLNTHYYIGMAALAGLLITGVAALLELVRFGSARKLTDQGIKVVLGLAIATLILMIAVDEFGFEVNHHELHLPAKEGGYLAPGTTPQLWSHVHMVLNHFPTVGFVVALTFFIIGLILSNNGMMRSALAIFVVCGVLIVPTYASGTASMWAITDPPLPGISKAVINAHRDMALLSLFGLAFTGGTAWLELWRYRYLGRFSRLSLYLILAFAIITLGILAETGHRGGQINHPEIRVAADELPIIQAPNQDAGWWTPAIEKLINNVIFFVPWQTVHFFGYSLIFGTVLAVVLRVLGFWKSLPFSAVHRLLPIGFFGVMMNVFTGMLMMMADTYRYVVTDTTFAPKMAFIPIGVMAILYFSVSDAVWNVKAGEDAPLSAKWVASLVLLSWTGVIMGGRLLPYV